MFTESADIGITLNGTCVQLVKRFPIDCKLVSMISGKHYTSIYSLCNMYQHMLGELCRFRVRVFPNMKTYKCEIPINCSNTICLSVHMVSFYHMQVHVIRGV